MELERAQKIADEVVDRLSPYCKKIQVVGSTRRRKPFPRDIDFVLIPSDPWNLSHEIVGLGPAKILGDKLKRVIYKDIQVDLYHASEETWSTLLLIRTGSAQNNIRLFSLAQKKGWRLKATGEGLFNERRGEACRRY